jgi:hypothetical protein
MPYAEHSRRFNEFGFDSLDETFVAIEPTNELEIAAPEQPNVESDSVCSMES